MSCNHQCKEHLLNTFLSEWFTYHYVTKRQRSNEIERTEIHSTSQTERREAVTATCMYIGQTTFYIPIDDYCERKNAGTIYGEFSVITIIMQLIKVKRNYFSSCFLQELQYAGVQTHIVVLCRQSLYLLKLQIRLRLMVYISYVTVFLKRTTYCRKHT